MKIDYVHFYVEDAQRSRDWFTQTLGFTPVAGGHSQHTQTEVVTSGSINFVLSSPMRADSPVAQFLAQHPAGVADLAFQVKDLESTITRAVDQGAKVLQPVQEVQQAQGYLKWAKLLAWGDISHTFLQRSGRTSLLPLLPEIGVCDVEETLPRLEAPFTQIDHVVLNVAGGDLERAVTWYQNTLGFRPQQAFAIQTEHSGLCSRVMVHPEGGVQLPINEPTSANSQIQEFLDVNRGPGIQHIALRTANIVQAIAQLRQRGLALLRVPISYYAQLQQRQGFQLSAADWQAIAAQQILVDWQDEAATAMLLQTFTEPIFGQPTFFFEIIERQVYSLNGQCRQAQGFGEGNFRALFEAIEREQLKRGSLR